MRSNRAALWHQHCSACFFCQAHGCMDAFQDSDTGFPIRYRFDDNIFNLRRRL